LGFWRYSIAGDSWFQLTDVPAGPRGKKVKGGTDMVYVEKGGVGYVYLLKGYKTEFYRYNTLTQEWQTMPDAPYGYKEKWDKGSWLAYDGASDGYIYAHEAKYYDRTLLQHYMFRYDLVADTWSRDTLAGMPLLGLHGGRIRKKKAKDGSSGAFDNGRIFALKGGNTQQFYKYDIGQDAWVEMDTMPTFGSTGRRKRVKYGADIVAWGQGAFFALKGNKTNECWRYIEPVGFGSRPERSGVMAGRTGQVPVGLTCAPNPFAGGLVTVRYSLPHAGPGIVRVLDITGREVLRRNLAPARTGALGLDIRHLSAGVYLVRLDAGGYSATGKLVVEK
jgi:hypothetical protein